MLSDDALYKVLLEPYFGEVVVGEMYNSPLPGRRDYTPSFGLFEKDGVICWKDFALSEVSGNKAVNLLMEMRDMTYAEAMDMIENEIEPQFITNSVKAYEKLRRCRKVKTLPFVSFSRKFKPYELAYWERFQITEEELLRDQVYAMRKLTYEGSDEVLESVEGDPAFVYWFSKSPASFKIYRPQAEPTIIPREGLPPKVISNKFRLHNTTGVIEGWNVLPQRPSKPTRLPLVSSTKDRLVIKKLFQHALNPTGESSWQPLVEKKEELQRRGYHPVILYDADDPGWKATEKLMKETGWPGHDMRGRLNGEKDFSDFVDIERGGHSYEELYNVVKNIIL